MTEIQLLDGKYVMCIDVEKNVVTTEMYKIEPWQDYIGGKYVKKESRRLVFKNTNML